MLKLQRLLPQIRYKSDVFSRYQTKLQQKAKTLGYANVDELNKKLQDKIELTKKQLNAIDPLKELELHQAKVMETRKNNDQIKIRPPIDKETPELPYKTLDSFVDVDKLKDLTNKEIELIWRARFLNKERSLAASLNNLQFAKLYALAFKNPTFILPLPKDNGGYEMHFMQWAFVGPHTTHCMLTTVAEYKLHKEYAKPHTTLVFHQELSLSKNLVLMNGHVEQESNISTEEAHLLVLNIQRFYGAMNTSDTKVNLVKSFNLGDQQFDMQKLIDEATSFD